MVQCRQQLQCFNFTRRARLPIHKSMVAAAAVALNVANSTHCYLGTSELVMPITSDKNPSKENSPPVESFSRVRLKVGGCGELLHRVPDKVGPGVEWSRVALILDGLISDQLHPAAVQVRFTNPSHCLMAGALSLAVKLSGTPLKSKLWVESYEIVLLV
ncbi:hypothetical protein BDW72DRAFT_177987 [Aspergillus terricola var. indicus]